VVDVIAGFGLTIITVVFGEWYYRWREKRLLNPKTADVQNKFI
jgi:hypothetical protein